MKPRRFFILLLICLLLIAGTQVVFSKGIKSNALELVAPAGCPLTGCAAGQRLNYRLTFQVNPVYLSEDNVMVCVTSTGGSQTTGFALIDFSTGYISSQGLVSGAPYTSIPNCSGISLPGEDQIVSVSAQLSTNSTDQLNLAVRLNRLADANGSLKYHLFEKDAGGIWREKEGATTLITVASSQTLSVFVAENSSQCNLETPCFINSGDDLAGGMGTGLKDALDALPGTTSDAPATITILGTYPIKGNEVLLDKPNIILQGRAGSTLTSAGTNCSAPMLGITSSVTLQNLIINDGECTSVSRNLIRVNSSLPVIIQRNTLQNGAHAILYEDNAGNLLVRFNLVSNNVGNAIRRVGTTGAGKLTAVANNFISNAWSTQIECGAPEKGMVDHNFWGSGISAATASSHCTFTAGAQLGAAISPRNTGVDGELVQVSQSNTSLFNAALSVKRSLGSDYWLYVVNHGQGASENVPFLNYGTDAITACSNFYDIFLGSMPSSDSDLIASFKYNLNSSCEEVIESQSYCGQQSNPALFPLWWFDPKYNLTTSWDPVGEAHSDIPGQSVVCDTTQNTITMTIDADGRPNLTQDLNLTPFVVGLPLPNGVQLTEEGFTGSFYGNRIDLNWTTISEGNFKGFYVQRSESSEGTYFRISELINKKGNAFLGGIYNYSDTTIQSNKTYYYKLEVIDDLDLSLQLFGPISITSATPTPTATKTPTITPTRTQTPTRTAYIYRSPTSRYRTNTPTPMRTATSRYQTATVTRTTTKVTELPKTATTPDLTATSYSATNQPTKFSPTTTQMQSNSQTWIPSGIPSSTPSDITPTTSTGKFLDKSDRYGGIFGLVIPLGIVLGICVLTAIIWLLLKKK